MEGKSFTILKHVIGEDDSKYTAVEMVQMKLNSDADVGQMVQAYREFLLAIGYQEESVNRYIDLE